MRKRVAGTISVGALALGIFAGIGFDRSTWLSGDEKLVTSVKAAGRAHKVPTFETESSNLVYLALAPSEKFSVAANGGAVQPYINFDDGETPCSEPNDSGSDCTIDPKTPLGGVYFFSCDANGTTYNCPDPGVVVRDAPPTQDEFTLQYLGYFADVAVVLKHVIKGVPAPSLTIKTETGSAEAKTQAIAEPNSSKTKTAKAEGGPVGAIQLQAHIVCDKSANHVDVFPVTSSGGKNSAIPVPQGSSLVWVANYPFTVTLMPPYACGPKTLQIPSSLSDGFNQAVCMVPATASLGNHPYTASTGGGTCKTQKTEYITVTTAPAEAK